MSKAGTDMNVLTNFEPIAIELDEQTLEDIRIYREYGNDESSLVHLGLDLIRLYEEGGGEE